MEVGGDTSFEVLGLAYINDSVVLVIKLVAPWFLRHAEHDILEIGLQLRLFFLFHIVES